MISLFKKNSYKWTIIPIVTLTLLGGVMLTNAKNKPVLADNKYKQDSKAITTLSNVSKISIERYNTSDGKTFTGNLLIIKDPTRVKVGYSNKLGKRGELTSQIAQDNGAIAAINAGGFSELDKKNIPLRTYNARWKGYF